MTLKVTVRRYEFIIVAVYGLHTVGDRRELWDDLMHIIDDYSSPMIILGDFNAVNNSVDRKNGVYVSEAETQDFANF